MRSLRTLWGSPSRGRVCAGAPLRRSAPKARRLRCGARVSVAPHNSLHSLRSLRSDRCGESVDEAREYARRPKPCAPRRRTGAPAPTRPRLGEAATVLWGEKAESRASSPVLALWRACGARQPEGSMPSACQTLSTKNDRSRKAWGRPALGCVCGGEERSPGVGARTRALRKLTRRSCSNATSAASEVSSAARPQGEYRSVPCAAGRRIRTSAPAGPMPCIQHTAGEAPYSRTVANAHNGPIPAAFSPATDLQFVAAIPRSVATLSTDRRRLATLLFAL
jgi:hypothetical protein